MEGAQGRAPALGFGVIISLWPLERQGRAFLFVMPVNRTCAILIIEFAILVLMISLTTYKGFHFTYILGTSCVHYAERYDILDQYQYLNEIEFSPQVRKFGPPIIQYLGHVIRGVNYNTGTVLFRK